MLHPQARALIDLMAERGVPPTHTLTPEAARAAYRDRRALTQPDPPAVAVVRDLRADTAGGGIALRLYRPLGSGDKTPLPAMVYFHGGGWVMGDLDTHDVLCRELANASGCAVVAVDYRLGPEHCFPAAVDDALAATRWIHANASALALDAERLAVGGDSAGGNLAAVVAIAAREAGDLPVAFQLLIYPATDMRGGHASRTANGEGYVLTQNTMNYFQGRYLGSPAAELDWRASPLLCADLASLPPALVVTAGYDPLRDEGLDYAQALTLAGNKVSQICFERQIHGFITMGRVLDEAQSAVAICASELRRSLQP
ncbi:MAG: alpha/beta hydrolase [Acidovorax temperans]|uniref:alpha/beta hydrolase n=1 Tax=Acidovorax temperans TaxID=80878 RepID=UPI00391A1930